MKREPDMTANDHTSLNLLASQVVALAKACGATIVTARMYGGRAVDDYRNDTGGW